MLPVEFSTATDKLMGYKPRSDPLRANVLARRLPELDDIPCNYKLKLYTRGCIAGEEDVLLRKCYRADLVCNSVKGTVISIPLENFINLLKVNANTR